MTGESLARLRGMGPAELEGLLRLRRPVVVPAGRYRGHYLCRIEPGGPRHPLVLATFRLVPFGVDFDARLWFFGHARLALGRFEPRVGPSRWRETEIVTLRYDSSWLPRPIRHRLYDEVLPLSADLCLGIGGVNGPRGEGDLFFFALERIDIPR